MKRFTLLLLPIRPPRVQRQPHAAARPARLRGRDPSAAVVRPESRREDRGERDEAGARRDGAVPHVARGRVAHRERGGRRSTARARACGIFGIDYADDQVAKVTASAIGGKWYEPNFPAATFVAPSTRPARSTPSTRTTTRPSRCSASRRPPPPRPRGKTLLVYDTPIMLYRFPLAPGAAWTASGR